MNKPRKTRSDTVAGALETNRLVKQGAALEWPESSFPLDTWDDVTQDFLLGEFNEMLQSRNFKHWRPHHAGLLAEIAIINLEQRKLLGVMTKAGSMSKGGKNGDRLTRSPILDSMATLSALRQSLLKSAGINTASAENDQAASDQHKVRSDVEDRKRGNPGLSLLAQ